MIEMLVVLEREVDEDDDANDYGVVRSSCFQERKIENWWVVLGDPKEQKILGIKRTQLLQSAKIKMIFDAPVDAGDHNLVLYCLSDSYIGCDQEYSINLVTVEDD